MGNYFAYGGRMMKVKKYIAFVILIVLCITMFAACDAFGNIENNSADELHEFGVLLREMSQMEEYLFEANVVLDLKTDDYDYSLSEMRTQIYGTVSHRSREMQAMFFYENARTGIDAELELFLFGDLLYMHSSTMLEYHFAPLLRNLNLDMDEVCIEELLGIAWITKEGMVRFDEMRFTPFIVGDNFDARPFLTRDGERFTLTLYDGAVSRITDDAVLLIRQLFLGDAGFNRDWALEDAVGYLQASNLHDARFSITVAHTEQGFQQTIVLDVPERLHLWGTFTFVPEVIFPYTRPEPAKDYEEFEAFVDNLNANGTLLGEDEIHIRIIRDEINFQLINHEVQGNRSFERVLFPTAFGSEHYVTATSGGNINRERDHIDVDAGAMGMYYAFSRDMDAVAFLIERMTIDNSLYFLPDSRITPLPLRTNATRDLALVGLLEQTASGMLRVCIYAAQVIEEDVTLALTLKLYLHLFTEREFTILEEFGALLGIDLIEIIQDLAVDVEELAALLTSQEENEEND